MRPLRDGLEGKMTLALVRAILLLGSLALTSSIYVGFKLRPGPWNLMPKIKM